MNKTDCVVEIMVSLDGGTVEWVSSSSDVRVKLKVIYDGEMMEVWRTAPNGTSHKPTSTINMDQQDEN